jgi:L,D-transpeptidase ErfK/SrfK
MFPEDIEFLFNHVPVNTKVRIINEPVKFGWNGDEIVMEAHPTLVAGSVATSDAPLPDPEGGAEESESVTAAPAVVAPGDPVADALVPEKDPLTSATEQFIAVTGDRGGELDWTLVESAIGRADGLPVTVGAGIKNAATSAASD